MDTGFHIGIALWTSGLLGAPMKHLVFASKIRRTAQNISPESVDTGGGSAVHWPPQRLPCSKPKWQFPQIGGPDMDAKIVGLLLQGLPRNRTPQFEGLPKRWNPPIHRNKLILNHAETSKTGSTYQNHIPSTQIRGYVDAILLIFLLESSAD